MSTTNYLKTALLLGLMTGLILAVGQVLGGRSGMLMALAFAAVMNFVSYWFSDRIVLAMYRGREVSPAEAPRFHAIVDRLIGRADLPKPKLYLLPGESPNAFATGRNPQHAAVAATEGILSLMSDEELEGVIAHELAHVKNRDILISSVAATIAGAITFLATMARWGALFGGYGSNDDRGRGGNIVTLLLTAILPRRSSRWPSPAPASSRPTPPAPSWPDSRTASPERSKSSMPIRSGSRWPRRPRPPTCSSWRRSRAARS
jgi:heat shock protein HtpX